MIDRIAKKEIETVENKLFKSLSCILIQAKLLAWNTNDKYASSFTLKNMEQTPFQSSMRKLSKKMKIKQQ